MKNYCKISKGYIFNIRHTKNIMLLPKITYQNKMSVLLSNFYSFFFNILKQSLYNVFTYNMLMTTFKHIQILSPILFFDIHLTSAQILYCIIWFIL